VVVVTRLVEPVFVLWLLVVGGVGVVEPLVILVNPVELVDVMEPEGFLKELVVDLDEVIEVAEPVI
jgi:hypothetical protein